MHLCILLVIAEDISGPRHLGVLKPRRLNSTSIERRLNQKVNSIYNQHSVVILHVLNEGFIEITKSWICNVRRYDGVLSKTLFVVTDQAAYQALTTFDKALNVVFEAYSTPKNMAYGDYLYYDYMLFRTKLVLRLLQQNVTLWLVEADAVWLQDPSAMVFRTPGDIVTMDDQASSTFKVIQGGFQLLRPTDATVSAWSRLARRLETTMKNTKKGLYMGRSGNEQFIMSSIVSVSSQCREPSHQNITHSTSCQQSVSQYNVLM